MDKDFLLRTYGQCYGNEAGRWNLSVANKYLEFAMAKYFEDNIYIGENFKICNIGIGAGYWDRYLSYLMPNTGMLTSIDKDELSCRQFRECLVNENNPNNIEILHKDVLQINDRNDYYDIVTMVGSTRIESGLYDDILIKASNFLKPGGKLYYVTFDNAETMNDFVQFSIKHNLVLINHLYEEKYNFHIRYWVAQK